MKENIKKATIEYSDMIGEVFNLYRVFYNQESNVEIAQKYIKQRLENNESIISYIINYLIGHNIVHNYLVKKTLNRIYIF